MLVLCVQQSDFFSDVDDFLKSLLNMQQYTSVVYVLILCLEGMCDLNSWRACSIVSNSLWLHGLQHVRPPCPSLYPRVCSKSGCWVSDVIQPFHRLSSLSSPAFSLSQGQGLFQWASFSLQVDKILEFQLQHQSFQWICMRADILPALLGPPF